MGALGLKATAGEDVTRRGVNVDLLTNADEGGLGEREGGVRHDLATGYVDADEVGLASDELIACVL